jgi:hypothetical protein
MTEEFDGDTVIVQAKAMTTADALNLSDSTDDLIKKFGTYLISVTGLKDAAGNEVSKETMLEEAYFLPLVGKLAEGWAARSIPNHLKSQPSVK